MKALVISSSSEVERALALHFEHRQRPFMLLAPGEVSGLEKAQLENSVVIEASTVAALQRGTSAPISQSDRAHLHECCQQAGVPLVFLSDGRVFDGSEASLNHRETESPQPASVAGGQLSSIEAQIQGLERYVVLRTGPLFSESGDNFLTRLFHGMQSGERLALSTLLKFCPTHTADLARVVSGLVDQISCGAECWGIYHYNSSGRASAYEFAEVIYAFASQQVDLVTANSKLIADEAGLKFEPPVPVLRCEKILRHFGIKQLPWRSFIPKSIKYLCEGDSK